MKFCQPLGNFNQMAITVVSGLPRSGTSLIMQMLQAGGQDLLIDGRRTADPDNPKGYFEYEPVKRLKQDNSWLPRAEGKAVKIISSLLFYLPPSLTYKIILMKRPLKEVLASQAAMLARMNRQGSAVDDEKLLNLFAQQMDKAEYWLSQQPNLTVLPLWYHQVIQDPAGSAEMVANFLDLPLKVEAMVKTVDPNLYRQRRDKRGS
jgi:hypothetical protein